MRPFSNLALAATLVALTAGFSPKSAVTPKGSESYSLADLMPAIEASFQQIERAQDVNELMTNGPEPRQIPTTAVFAPRARPSMAVDSAKRLPLAKPAAPAPLPECSDCGPQLKDLRYQQCSNKNDYLEDDLLSLSGRGGLASDLLLGGPKSNTVIKPACLKSILETKFGQNSKSFRSCDAKGTMKQVFRPCVSENYFTLMNNSFDLVNRCMAPMLSGGTTGQASDIRAVFAMAGVESGMHVNAMSGTGAGGVGQFTSGAIKAVNDGMMAEVRTHLEAQGGNCARLASEVLASRPPMRSGTSARCDRISLGRGNPMLNMVYTYAYLTQSKRQINGSIFSNRRYKSFFSDLSKADLNRLKTSATIWSHNTGTGGLGTPLMALLNSKYRGKKVTDVNLFLRELAQAMKDYPHKANRSQGRRKETSKYWPAIQDTIAKVEKNVGGGSCVTQ